MVEDDEDEVEMVKVSFALSFSGGEGSSGLILSWTDYQEAI